MKSNEIFFIKLFFRFFKAFNISHFPPLQISFKLFSLRVCTQIEILLIHNFSYQIKFSLLNSLTILSIVLPSGPVNPFQNLSLILPDESPHAESRKVMVPRIKILNNFIILLNHIRIIISNCSNWSNQIPISKFQLDI